MARGSEPIVIDRRFCGPKASANGGYASGVFARAIEGPAEVTLKAPPRFDVPIAFEALGDGAVAAVSGGVEIARMKQGAVTIDPPALPGEREITRAHDAFLRDGGMTTIYPYCFVCGKKRGQGDGLRIFAGEVEGSPVNADYWTPDASLAGDDGLVAPEYLWAALDCPGAFALRGGTAPVLLGRFTAEIRRRPKPGERLAVAAWKTGEEGRKRFSSSAIYDASKKVIAAANAIWIEIADPELIERLRSENE